MLTVKSARRLQNTEQKFVTPVEWFGMYHHYTNSVSPSGGGFCEMWSHGVLPKIGHFEKKGGGFTPFACN